MMRSLQEWEREARASQARADQLRSQPRRGLTRAERAVACIGVIVAAVAALQLWLAFTI